jgi:hypothetical protein
MPSLRHIGTEIRRQARRVEAPRPTTFWFGVCPNSKCAKPHPPVIKNDMELPKNGIVNCPCGTRLIFLLKQGDAVVPINNPRGQHFVYICTTEGSRCAPRFRNEAKPPNCQKHGKMKLAIGVSQGKK